MNSQEISDILLGDSCNSDLDVLSFTELPKERLHKHVVKTGLSLFLSAGFRKYDRLVAALKGINIIPGDLLTIVSVLLLLVV